MTHLRKNWKHSQTSTPQVGDSIHFNHPQHGTVSVIKDNGQYHVKHNGGYANALGKKAIFSNPKDAMNHVKNYIGQLNSNKNAGKASMNANPSKLGKNFNSLDSMGIGATPAPMDKAKQPEAKPLDKPRTFGTTEQMHPTGKNTVMGQIARKQSLDKLRALKKPNLGKTEELMKKTSALDQAKDLLKSLKENPAGIEELNKALDPNQHVKGVHLPVHPARPGMSQMGKMNALKTGGSDFSNSAAKHQVKQVSAQAQAIKPKLGKEEPGSEITQEDKDTKEPSGTMGVKNPKDINPLKDKIAANPDYKPESEEKLKDMVNKEEKKPEAKKGCPHCGETQSTAPGHGHGEQCKLYRPMKKEEKGVHKPAFMHGKGSGTSDVGARMIPGNNKKGSQLNSYAKEEHKKVLAEAQAMPKPNLGKAAPAPMAAPAAPKPMMPKASPQPSMGMPKPAAAPMGMPKPAASPTAAVMGAKPPGMKAHIAKAGANPDMKQDAALGAKVENAVENHMMANAGAEAQEGHPMAKAYFKSKLAKCRGM